MIRQVVFIIVCVLINIQVIGQVGIGTTTPDESAVLDVFSTDKGLLPPRLTEIQRNGISNPKQGLIIYNLSEDCLQINLGTAISPNWSCIKGKAIDATVITDCNVSGFVGDYINGFPFDEFSYENRYTFTITNNGFSNASFNLAHEDLELSGVNGLSVYALYPYTFTLAPGESQFVLYALVGTPESTGTLTGVWKNLALTCTNTVHIANPSGDANFSNIPVKGVVSVNDGSIDIQGIIDNGSNKLTVNIPYTSGYGAYGAYSGTFVLNNPGTSEGSDANSFRLTFPGGFFSSSGVITATIEVDGDGVFNVKKQLIGLEQTIASLDFQINGVSKGNIDINAVGGIPDRNFSNPNHKFVYLPILAADGNTWLNNNLGADYSNINNPSFDLSQQAIAYNDYHAYGSLFQWGRLADGHELIQFTSSTSGTGGNIITATTTPLDVPGHSNFINAYLGTLDWHVPENPNLWQGLSGINNPCPIGYRLPTETEIVNLFTSESITNNISAASSSVKFSGAGTRIPNSFLPSLFTVSPNGSGSYWTSTIDGTESRYQGFDNSSANIETGVRGRANSVRCIKD